MTNVVKARRNIVSLGPNIALCTPSNAAGTVIGGASHGLNPQNNMSLTLPTVKHTGQESGSELCEIFKF